jgi:hypothetical protein
MARSSGHLDVDHAALVATVDPLDLRSLWLRGT